MWVDVNEVFGREIGHNKHSKLLSLCIDNTILHGRMWLFTWSEKLLILIHNGDVKNDSSKAK